MKVAADLSELKPTLNNNGMVLELSEGDKHLGMLRIERAKVEWHRGKTRRSTGKSIGIKKLIGLIEEHGS